MQSPHQAAQFAWFATLVCKWRRSPTIRDAIDGLTRHPPDRVQSSSSARMAGNTQLVWLTAAPDAEPQEGHASCIATLVLGRKSEADEE